MNVNARPGDYVRNTYMRSAPSPPCEAVWVHLDLLWPVPQQRRTIIDGLDFRGRARGLIFRWLRTGDGLWVGVVSYEIAYCDGRPQRVLFRNQLVPGHALSQRDDGRPLAGSDHLTP